MPIRLVAVRVNEETANVRRMKAKQHMNGQAPSSDLLKSGPGDMSPSFGHSTAMYSVRVWPEPAASRLLKQRSDLAWPSTPWCFPLAVSDGNTTKRGDNGSFR